MYCDHFNQFTNTYQSVNCTQNFIWQTYFSVFMLAQIYMFGENIYYSINYNFELADTIKLNTELINFKIIYAHSYHH